MANCQISISLKAAACEVLILFAGMRDFISLLIHMIVSMVRLAGPGGTPVRGCRIRAGPPSPADPQSRAPACAQPARLGSHRRRLAHPLDEPGTHARSAIVLKPSTLLHLHNLLS